MPVYFDQLAHPLAETRYGLDGTPTEAHSGVATPCNRIIITRRCALNRDVQVSQAQGVQERPLLDVHGWTSVLGSRMLGMTCTPVDIPFNPSNCGF